jgi:hypothetical protein
VDAWYFTGREEALNELSQWLEQSESDGLVRVVTGSPGCGKSALLARVSLLPFIQSAGASHTPNVISASISAHGKLLLGISAAIPKSLGENAENAGDLVKAIADSSRKFVITVDGLDEADQISEVVARLLVPLAQARNVFLIVGTRPDSIGGDKRVMAFGEASVEIDLDDERFIGDDDVAHYIEKRLLATKEPDRRTPYRAIPDIAREVARAVASRANNNFLVANTAMQALLAADQAVDIGSKGWIERLPDGLDKAFSQFLSAVSSRPNHAVSAEIVQSVLLALAFAEGEGLPWVNIWPTVAISLLSKAITDSDISSV